MFENPNKENLGIDFPRQYTSLESVKRDMHAAIRLSCRRIGKAVSIEISHTKCDEHSDVTGNLDTLWSHCKSVECHFRKQSGCKICNICCHSTFRSSTTDSAWSGYTFVFTTTTSKITYEPPKSCNHFLHTPMSSVESVMQHLLELPILCWTQIVHLHSLSLSFPRNHFPIQQQLAITPIMNSNFFFAGLIFFTSVSAKDAIRSLEGQCDRRCQNDVCTIP